MGNCFSLHLGGTLILNNLYIWSSNYNLPLEERHHRLRVMMQKCEEGPNRKQHNLQRRKTIDNLLSIRRWDFSKKELWISATGGMGSLCTHH
ncbi:hypothetical protein M758_UG063400 [Ceratodon purpureus]|nr:hypothetical protein M758_UG063400 [Ceratodon purpureus]